MSQRYACWFAGLAVAALLGVAAPAHASGYQVIYRLGPTDGVLPRGLVAGPSGALFGVVSANATAYGVFELAPPAAGQTQWRYSLIYTQPPMADAAYINSPLRIDQGGNIYFGTQGGVAGYAYRLSPPASGQTAWTPTLLYHHLSFKYPNIASFNPAYVDSSGVVFGYDFRGSALFALVPPVSAAAQGVLVTLSSLGQNADDGQDPSALVHGIDGSFYGSTYYGGGPGKQGTIFHLMRPAAGQTAWTRQTIFSFSLSDPGNFPIGLIADRSFNLYGLGLGNRQPAAFRLSPPAAGTTRWTESILYRFNANTDPNPLINVNGLLFGTTVSGGGQNYCIYGGPGCGTLFKLAAPSATGSTASWHETVLHDFIGDGTDGGNPSGALVKVTLADHTVALFGATYGGGGTDVYKGAGTIFEYVP